MSATSCLLSEDQFLCSICLDVFTDPVSTPCGHNFCKGCITKHWEISLTCQCPNCKMAFNPKPKLHVNTFISEMVAVFTQAAQRAASREPLLVRRGNLSEPGEVPCDACIGTKRRALKSCLECLVSYCEAHLEPHLKLSRLKRHQLIDPVKEVLERKKAELMKTEADLQQQIVEKQMDIQEIEDSLETSRRNADRAIKTGDQVFTRMKEAIEMKQAKAVKIIEEHRKTANEQAAGLIRDLRVEILSLQKRRTKLVQLMQSGDDLSLLQYEEAGPSSRSCQRTTFSPPHYGMIVRKAVTLLIQDLNKGRELETIQLQFPSA